MSDSMVRTAIDSPVQPLIVGASADFTQSFTQLLGEDAEQSILIDWQEYLSTEWQGARRPGNAWAVLVADPSAGFDALYRSVQLVSISFRPSRLVVLCDSLELEQQILLVRAGADGVHAKDVSVEAVVSKLRGDGISHEALFPDPVKWLNSLQRVSEELLLTDDLNPQLQKLLRVFTSQLGVDRATISLLQGKDLVYVAGVNLPAGLQMNVAVPVRPESITGWVLSNRRARLVEGEFRPSQIAVRSEVRSAVCAPLQLKGELLGAVSFSSLKTGRLLNQADLATVEVFSNLLAMAIWNQKLYQKNLEAERLATVGGTIANVVHCMKNLLQIFHGSLSLIQKATETDNPSMQASGLMLLDRGLKRFDFLVAELLDYAKPREPEPAPTDLSALLSEALIFLTPPQGLGGRDIDIRCGVKEMVNLDGPRLQRVLINLMSNSMDAIGYQGTIRVEVARESDHLFIAVSDSGPGVQEKDMDKLFQPFFSTKKSKGTGLGLAMAKRFCEENGGGIRADHCPDLKGLRLTLCLPITTAEPLDV